MPTTVTGTEEREKVRRSQRREREVGRERRGGRRARGFVRSWRRRIGRERKRADVPRRTAKGDDFFFFSAGGEGLEFDAVARTERRRGGRRGFGRAWGVADRIRGDARRERGRAEAKAMAGGGMAIKRNLQRVTAPA